MVSESATRSQRERERDGADMAYNKSKTSRLLPYRFGNDEEDPGERLEMTMPDNITRVGMQ